MRWLAPVLQRVTEIGIERSRRLAIAVLAAWIIACLAHLGWLLLPSATPAPVMPTPINAELGEVRQSGALVDIEAMVGWHLYGEVGAQPRIAAADEHAQETTLALQLLGVISASEPAQARAFILAEGRQQQFAVGEALPGSGVVLSKVLIDRVIIDNNGRAETLWLYDPAANARQPQPVTAAITDKAGVEEIVDMRSDPQVTALAQNYRQQLFQNPASLADVIQVAPAMEAGKLIGYQISPGRDQERFQALGLRPGDIVTGVNGIDLDDPQRALELYNLMRAARDASITVRRGSEQMTMMISLENND